MTTNQKQLGNLLIKGLKRSNELANGKGFDRFAAAYGYLESQVEYAIERLTGKSAQEVAALVRPSRETVNNTEVKRASSQQAT